MEQRGDFSTLAGIAAALLLVAIAISLGGSLKSYIDLPALLIVLGGTFALTTASFSFGEMMRAQQMVWKTIFYTAENPVEIGAMLIALAEEARKEGVLTLQNHLQDTNPYFKKGLTMVIDGVEPEVVEKTLRQELHAMVERHSKGVSILRRSAELSPAMGLIGTLIGLVQMLGNLDSPSSIGPAMAIALLTALYGAMLSYMVFTPLASKLERNSQAEVLVNTLYLKGVVSIAKNENPRRLEMALNTILPPAERLKYFD